MGTPTSSNRSGVRVDPANNAAPRAVSCHGRRGHHPGGSSPDDGEKLPHRLLGRRLHRQDTV